MPKQNKAKQTKNQAAYEKEIKRLERYVKKYEKLGVIFPEDIIPDMPKRVTAKRLKEIQKTKSRTLLSRGITPPTESFREEVFINKPIPQTSTKLDKGTKTPRGIQSLKLKDPTAVSVAITQSVLPYEEGETIAESHGGIDAKRLLDGSTLGNHPLGDGPRESIKPTTPEPQEETKLEGPQPETAKPAEQVIPASAFESSGPNEIPIEGIKSPNGKMSVNEGWSIIESFLSQVGGYAGPIKDKVTTYIIGLISELGKDDEDDGVIALAIALQQIPWDLKQFINRRYSDIDIEEFNETVFQFMPEDHPFSRMDEQAEFLNATGEWGVY